MDFLRQLSIELRGLRAECLSCTLSHGNAAAERPKARRSLLGPVPPREKTGLLFRNPKQIEYGVNEEYIRVLSKSVFFLIYSRVAVHSAKLTWNLKAAP